MALKLIPPRPGKTPFWYIRGTLYGRLYDASTKETDKAAARGCKERLEIKLREQKDAKYAPATFATAADMYIKYRQPRDADKKFIAKLVAAIGPELLINIKQHMLIETANFLLPNGAPETKNRQVLTAASSILHYAAQNDLCPYIQVKKFKESTPEPRALTKEQALVIIAAAEGRMKMLLMFLFYQGWRISDALRLTWGDVDMAGRQVRYHVSKTDERCVMPLHPKVMAALEEIGIGVGRLFPWQNKSNLYRALRTLNKKTGFHFTPHMARHSFATWLINQGASSAEIMEAGRWKDHKSVMRYAKIDQARVRSVIGKLV
jgi:integrase